ncbi:basic 7S globulin-like [Dorcoceras hygrometricum]|uniref:Basic 7S globulin-like n=1 Tax=Dorcoceras hygrometricum TaxID=472368 RepID=A0A2Z7CJK9_9LAMI|nr:basic 7S globulin-like [Dorcoceras hygrometricum]
MRREVKEMKRRRDKESADGLALMTSSRFAFALKIQQMLFALISSSRKIPAGSYSISSRELQCYFISSRHGIPDARKAEVAKHCNQAQSIQSTKNSAEAQSSSSDEPAAKQLTIYEELSKLDVNC